MRRTLLVVLFFFVLNQISYSQINAYIYEITPNNDKSVTFKWELIGNAYPYEYWVYKGLDSSSIISIDTIIDATLSGGHACVVNGLHPNTLYNFALKVVTVNYGGEIPIYDTSDFSNIVSVKTDEADSIFKVSIPELAYDSNTTLFSFNIYDSSTVEDGYRFGIINKSNDECLIYDTISQFPDYNGFPINFKLEKLNNNRWYSVYSQIYREGDTLTSDTVDIFTLDLNENLKQYKEIDISNKIGGVFAFPDYNDFYWSFGDTIIIRERIYNDSVGTIYDMSDPENPIKTGTMIFSDFFRNLGSPLKGNELISDVYFGAVHGFRCTYFDGNLYSIYGSTVYESNFENGKVNRIDSIECLLSEGKTISEGDLSLISIKKLDDGYFLIIATSVYQNITYLKSFILSSKNKKLEQVTYPCDIGRYYETYAGGLGLFVLNNLLYSYMYVLINEPGIGQYPDYVEVYIRDYEDSTCFDKYFNPGINESNKTLLKCFGDGLPKNSVYYDNFIVNNVPDGGTVCRIDTVNKIVNIFTNDSLLSYKYDEVSIENNKEVNMKLAKLLSNITVLNKGNAINIDFKVPGNYSIGLYNVLGKKVLSKRVINEMLISFDLRNLTNGYYILKVNNGSSVIALPIIKK